MSEPIDVDYDAPWWKDYKAWVVIIFLSVLVFNSGYNCYTGYDPEESLQPNIQMMIGSPFTQCGIFLFPFLLLVVFMIICVYS
jgi:hypothetical protein